MSWLGHIYLDRGWLLYDGPVVATALHAHHAIQLMLAGDPPVQVKFSANASIVSDVALIPANAPHAFASTSPRVALLYVAPESRVGRQLTATLRGVHAADGWVEAASTLRGVAPVRIEDWETARRTVDEVLRRLLPAPVRTPPWPPVIQRLVTIAPERLDDALRLRDMAAELGLSESRLAHLVVEHLGIPFRPYVSWLRLQRATAEIARGRTLTQAAHHAGFADGAHLSRVFKRMFGIAPSDVAGWARWHLAP